MSPTRKKSDNVYFAGKLILLVVWFITLGLTIYFLNKDYHKYSFMVIPAFSLITVWVFSVMATLHRRGNTRFAIYFTISMLLMMFVVHVVYWNIEYGLSNLFIWNILVIMAVIGVIMTGVIFGLTEKVY